MSNLSEKSNMKVIPYCKDPMSSCGLFAYGFAAQSKSHHKCSGNCGGDCDCAKGEKFSAFDWGGLFGGGGSDDNTPTAPTPSGQAPSPFLPTPTGEAASSGGGFKISADQVMSGIESAAELAKLFGTKRALSEVETVCGKQRSGILVSRAKKQAWANCASAYMQSKLDAGKKKDGLSTGAIIGIVSGSALLLGAIIFAAVKMGTAKPKMAQSQMIQPQA